MTDQPADFRSVRALLPEDAFAYAVGPQSRPTDLISSKTWSSIMALPDDVSIRNTNHFGPLLEGVWLLWGGVDHGGSCAARRPRALRSLSWLTINEPLRRTC